MNKNLHRIIFNATRGMRMVVQETARSAGKSTTTASGLGVALSTLLCVASAQAQIVGAPNVPGNQRPTVLAAPNGVPLVNIQTPSAAGVSRNVYSRFDIEQRGAILNNSRTSAQTQLGGWVQGNPYLATGPARVIVNEINSGNPSQIRGWVEVAGQRAEVVIANPAGISIDGGGFLNASRATVSTGVPQFNAFGGLDGFRVGGGTIRIDGKGLDLSQTDYAAIYARALQVNASIQANDLKVVTGANDIGADGTAIAPMAGTGPAPAFALDVAQLGGMYANKIHLIGTEAGLGVRNAGNIGAGAGGLVVTAAGRLENSGTLEGPRIELASAGDIDNLGGTIRQTSMAALTLAAPTLVNANGGIIGREPAAVSSGTGESSGSSEADSGAGVGTAGAGSGAGGIAAPGASDQPSTGAGADGTAAVPAAPVAPGVITAAGTIRNNGGHIYAGGTIDLKTPSVSNAGGRLGVSSLAVTGPIFSNAGGMLDVANGFSANVASFDNSGGKLNAGRLDIATTGDLLNEDGKLTSNGDANLHVGGLVNNQRGTISAAGALDARVAGDIQNTSGSLLANQAISIQGRSLDNTLGTVASTTAGTSLSLVDALMNSGQISAATDLSVRAGSLSNTGTLRAESDARIAVANALNNDGSITAGRNVTANAATLQGGSHGVLGAGIDAEGSLGSTGALTVSTTGALVAQGTHLAAGDASLQGASVDLSGSQTGAANIAIAATQGDVTTSGATVATAGTLGIRADTHGAQTLVNQDGELNAGQLDLHASNIDNSGGGEIVQTGTGATTIAVSGSLTNARGRIASNGQDLILQATAFTNTQGRIEHAGSGTLFLEGGSFEGAGGTVVSNGALVVDLSGAFNQDGGKLSARQVTIDAASIGNREGEIVQIGEGATHIAASGVLDNTSGKVATNGTDLGLAATTLVNKEGTIQHAGTGTLSIDAQVFDGAGGRIASNGALAVQAGDFNQAGGELTAWQISIAAAHIDNRNGKITQFGDGATGISASGRFDNSDGQISTNGHDLSLSGGGFLNTHGAIAHAGAGTLALDAGSFDGDAGRIVSNGSLVVQAGDFSQDSGSMAAQQIRIDAANLSNRSGSIVQTGDGSTRIAVTGTLQNTGGRIATNGQDLALRAATLQNSNGAIEHAGAGTFNLDVGTYNATQGRLVSNGALAVRAGTYAQDGGATLAQQIRIDATDIANTHGAEIVQVGTGATHIAATGTLRNDGGRIASNGADMTLQAGTLSNAQGQLQHAGTGTMAIEAGSYAGAGGEITSNGALVVRAGDFEQSGGVTTAAQFTIDAATLGNRGGRIIQTGAGATRITVAGAIDNSAGGTIASNGDVAVHAGSLLNQGGTLRSAGASDLELNTTGLVDNSNGGEIGAGGNLALEAGSLRNDLGRVTAVGNMSANVVGAASNVKGTLAANGDTTITAVSLDNTRGVAAAVEGALRITTSGSTVNVGGTMQAGGDVVLENAGLDNSDGKVFGDTLSIDTRGNRLSNVQGTLAAATTVALNSGELLNDAGLIQSGGAMTVNTNGHALSNTNAAGHASGKGGITSAGTLDIASGALSNAGGYIGSKDALTASTANFVNTSGGIVFSQSSVAVDTHGATYDNAGGQTQAVGDLNVNAGTIKNAGGLFRSGATTTLTAGVIANTNTQGIDQGIEGRNVALNVGDLDNSSGAVRSDVDTTIISGGNVNNTRGLISAGETLRIADPNAANPAAKTLDVVNTDGVLTANKALQLDAARFSADGSVSSGRDLSVALTQDIVNNGEVSANGKLSYVTTGRLTNNGKLLAGETLTVGGNVVENTASAEMSGVDTIVRSGTLNNQGLIDSQGQTRIDAGTVNNTGTGRIYGDAVAIGAGTLDNTAGATIAARSTLDIGADTINNRDGALIFSAGDMYIGGALDANGFATGRGSVLNNESATVESLGDMSIAMANVNNIDTHLQVVQETNSENKTHLTTLDGRRWSKDDTRGDPFTGQVWHRNADGSETLVGIGYLDWQITETTTRDVATHLAPARLAAGGNMSIEGHLLNRDSKVTAGGALTATSVDNRATQGQSATSYSGLATGYDGAGVAFYPMTPYSDPARTIDIGRSEYTPNTNATTGYNPGTASGVSGPGGSAGHAGGVAGGSGPGTVIEVASAVSGSSRADGTQAAGQTGGVVRANGSSAATAGGSGAGAAAGSAAASATGAGAGDAVAGARDVAMVVRTSAPDTRLPTASLFQTKPGAGGYLVETDPRFANYRNWLGSDYLLNAMGLDPDNVQKRLGDGFYEQKLIREQVAQLTGYRYLDGFASDEDQYTALMNAGATFAQKYQLTPGIALTAEQMAQLTSDIVWLVEQTVTLPDGSTQRVLVPQVYVRVQPGDIDGSGALLSADRLTIKNEAGGGDFSNSGTVAGRSLVSITADNVNNLGGRISGGNVALDARADINVIGGTVDARDSLALIAGNDINVRTTTSSTQGALSSATSIDRIAGLYVSNPGGILLASAGRDLNLIATEVVSAGSVAIGAGRNVNFGTVTEASASASVFNTRNAYSESQSRDIGSAIQGTDDVRIAAGNDLNIKASSAASVEGALVASAGRDINIQAGQASESKASYSHSESKKLLSRSSATDFNSSSTTDVISSSLSGNTVALVAGNDINAQAAQLRSDKDMSLVAGRDISLTTADQVTQDSHYSARTKKATGLGMLTGVSLGAGDVGANFVAGSSSTSIGSTTSTQAIGTTVSAGSLQTVSGRDTTLQGATVVADNDITMLAGRNLTIESAQNTTTRSSFDANNQSGMIGSRTNPSLGNVKGAEAVNGSGVSQASSQVASLQGNVTLVAGETYRQTASSVMAAGQAGPLVGGDVNILAKNVVINEAFNTDQSFGISRNSSTVLGGSASVGGISTDSLRNTRNTAKAIGDTSDSRMQALGAINLAVAGGQAVDTAQALTSGGGVGYKVSVNVSRNKSEGSSISHASEAVGSSIVGANNVNIVATGGGAASNIYAVGSTIAAGNTVNLAADNAITLEASKNTYDKVGQNSSSGASVGVGFAGGSQNGFTIELGVSKGRGNENGSDVSYNNTHVSAGNAVNISSGGDLNLKGAVIDGARVNADVGGNLNIESLQDTSRQVSKQSSSGANVSLCIPPICYGVSTVGGNAARAKANGDFASVNEQSGIKAGDGGFNVNVKGNTDLKGGVIESTQAAIDAGNNSFKSGSLSISDIVNRSTSEGSSYAVSGNVGFAAGDQSGASSPADKRAADGAQASGRPGGSAGVGSSDSSQGSVTKSGISGIAGDESVRTGDNSSAGTLLKDWNTSSIVKDVQAQAQITQEFNQNAAREIGTYADKQRVAASARGDKEEAAKWDEGGEYRVAAHAAAGALSGGVTVALAAGASAALMPKIGEAIDEMGLPAPVAQALSAATAAAIGGLVGGAAGADSAYSVDINNRQLHPTEAKIIKDNAKRFAQQLYSTENPTPEQVETASAMLANTAQSQLDNNLGYRVQYSREADDFLQALKIEYMQQNGSLNLPGTQGTQQLFYATVDQKNNPALNQGLADSSISGLIVRTPISAAYNNPTNDPSRDKLTGLPVDEKGRYAIQVTIDGKAYEPKYFPCATADCVAVGKNLDTSDPATQAYLKAVDKMVMDDINKGATVVTLVSPVGVAGTFAGVLGPITSLVSGSLDGKPITATVKETVQFAAIQYMTKIYGIGEAAANRIAAVIDATGGWQAFSDRAIEEKKKESNEH